MENESIIHDGIPKIFLANVGMFYRFHYITFFLCYRLQAYFQTYGNPPMSSQFLKTAIALILLTIILLALFHQFQNYLNLFYFQN